MTEAPATSPGQDDTAELRRNLTQRILGAVAGLVAIKMPPSFSFRTLGSLFLWSVASLLVGWLLAHTLVPQPAVGIIRLNTDIWANSYELDSVELVMAQIEAACQDPVIKAVVLQLDSPGGEVAATQTLYLELQSLRQKMPVVSSIEGMAASGGFYVAMATDPIYAKPSSTVGNIGVWGFIPPDIGVNEVILASGPFKLTASNRAEFLRAIEGIKQEFLATVIIQRGERLNISPVDLSQGLAYSGRESLRLGLIDHLGSQAEAVATAAELAHIDHYKVIDLQARVIDELFEGNDPSFEAWIAAADPVTGKRILPPGAYLLYDVRLGGMP
ncbi:MAG: S49 family peptidase [Anaerolineales bacterium]|nr:MAG: S49 family peptidase [Anaerolineales bacterium]